VERIRTLERKVFLKHESLHESIHCELKRHPHIVAFESCSTTAGTAKHLAKDTNKAGSKTRQSKASRKAAKKAAKSGGGGGGTAIATTNSATAAAAAAATARKGLAASSHLPASSGGNGVVGYLWYARQALQVDVQKVCVCPSRRRQGVGRRMMTAFLAEIAASSSGSAVVRLHVAEENVAARGLYAGVGFHDVGRRVDYYREGRHARRMEVEVSELQERAAAAKEGEGEGCGSGGNGSGGCSSGGCGVVGSVGAGVGCGGNDADEEKGS
jgi:ribosomal protein S18 acetylase RimI-like enzyme